MDVTEVTRTDFFPFVEDPQNIRDSIARARLLQVAGSTGNSSGELPMTSVGHDEAQLYCESRGEGYRLPTEEQWHAAAYWNPQTGLLQRYPWGEALPAIGNFAGTLRAVALFTPNASGLHDMAGNAAEWVLGADRSDYRTLGGDYVSEPEETQFDTPDRRYNEATPLTGLERIGFRCVWQP